jgi:hypothetical protein
VKPTSPVVPAGSRRLNHHQITNLQFKRWVHGTRASPHLKVSAASAVRVLRVVERGEEITATVPYVIWLAYPLLELFFCNWLPQAVGCEKSGGDWI